MKTDIKTIVASACVFLAALAGSAASAQSKEVDAKGGKDHPLITRYAGSWLVAYGVQPFDSVDIPLSYKAAKDSFKLAETQTLEGEITRLAYLAPFGRGMLEVQRNYESALEAAGAKKLLSCAKEACDKGISGMRTEIKNYLYNLAKKQQAYDATSNIYAGIYDPSMHSLWKLSRPSGEVYISVISSASHEPKDRTATFVQVIQPKAMDTGKVSVTNADAIGKGIAADGKIALYGVYFDTGKAELKPESKLQLDEMGKLLNTNKALKVFIIGHTDNQGVLDANISLSQKRAQAIAGALVKDYKVDAKRLLARGVANYSPVVSNAQEAGRAKNRRVELVEQ
jgi:OmpA-OmpF porin, OOP family